MKNFKFKPWITVKNLRDSGFSIAEAMVALGILGVIILGLLSQQRLSVKGTAEIQSEAEMNSLVKRITSEIGVMNICSLGSAGTPINFGGQSPTRTSIPSLRRDSAPIAPGNPGLVEVGKIYGTGQGQVLISNISSYQKSGSDFEMVLVLEYYRKNASDPVNPGTPSLLDRFLKRPATREIPLSMILNGGLIERCYGDYDQIVKTAIELSCQGSNAVYDPTVNLPYGGCRHQVAPQSCPAGQFLKRVVGATIGAGTTFTCESFTTTCPVAGEMITGFKADGTPACGKAYPTCPEPYTFLVKNASGGLTCSKIECAANEGFQGFDASGAAVCQLIPGNKTCDPGNYAVQATDGTVTCAPAMLVTHTCPAGMRASGIDGTGTLVCTPFVILPASCPAGEAIYGFDATGYRMCRSVRRPLGCNIGADYHSYTQCRATVHNGVAGVVVNPGTANSMCSFQANNVASCPSGWNICSGNGTRWGAQLTQQCTDVSTTWYCAGNVATRNAVPVGGNGAFQDYNNNPAAHPVMCYSWNGVDGDGYTYICNAVPNAGPIYTYQSTIGCY